MNTLEIILLVVCAILALVFVLVRTLIGGKLGLLLKVLASFGFVAFGMIALALSNAICDLRWVYALIGIGLLLGMIGDIVLDLKVIYEGNDKYYLNAGMLSFFLGHVCYITAFAILTKGDISRVWLPLVIAGGSAVVLTAGIVLSSKSMGLNFGHYLIQTITYSFVLTFAMVYALALAIMGASMWVAFVGLLLFFLSDIVLSFQYFGGKISNKPLIAINHVLYYCAQIIILAVLFAI